MLVEIRCVCWRKYICFALVILRANFFPIHLILVQFASVLFLVAWPFQSKIFYKSVFFRMSCQNRKLNSSVISFSLRTNKRCFLPKHLFSLNKNFFILFVSFYLNGSSVSVPSAFPFSSSPVLKCSWSLTWIHG